MEFIKLSRLLKDVKVERVAEDGRLAILVNDVSKVLVDLGTPTIMRIPRECTRPMMSWRQWASSWSACGRPMPLATTPQIRRRPLPDAISSGHHALVFCLTFGCKYAKDQWCLLYPLLAFLSHRIIYIRADANCSLHPGVLQGIESTGKQ
jgi:hypothetical protein